MSIHSRYETNDKTESNLSLFPPKPRAKEKKINNNNKTYKTKSIASPNAIKLVRETDANFQRLQNGQYSGDQKSIMILLPCIVSAKCRTGMPDVPHVYLVSVKNRQHNKTHQHVEGNTTKIFSSYRGSEALLMTISSTRFIQTYEDRYHCADIAGNGDRQKVYLSSLRKRKDKEKPKQNLELPWAFLASSQVKTTAFIANTGHWTTGSQQWKRGESEENKDSRENEIE
ncbi:hypothetical protein STEG23_019476 [Scotinomys teguina]